MKSLLVLFVVIFAGLYLNAQAPGKAEIRLMQPANGEMRNGFEPILTTPSPELYSADNTAGSDLLKKDISTTQHVFALGSTLEQKLTRNPDLDLILFGHRAGGPMGYTANDLRINWSIDEGDTWEHIVVSVPGKLLRNPSFAVFNPPGNTHPNSALCVFFGTWIYTGGLEGNFWGSIQLDGSKLDIHFTEDEVKRPSGIGTFNDGRAILSAGWYDYAGNVITEHRIGQYDETTQAFDWSADPIVVPIETDSNTGAKLERVVFSPDGMVGCCVVLMASVDSASNPWGHRQPVVYKTMDGGYNWNKLSTAPLYNLPAFQEYLWPTASNPDLFIPQFWAGYIDEQECYGYTVDIHNNLHIFAQVRSAFSTHPDSLGYYYPEEPLHAFDLILPEDGIWIVQHVTEFKSQPYSSSWSGPVYDHRMQMARTADGEMVFAIWTDTDFIGVEQNEMPDIFYWCKNATTMQYVEAKNITEFTSYWLNNFWMFATDVVKEDGLKYHIPVTTSIPGETELDPLLNQLLTGVVLDGGDSLSGIEQPGKTYSNKIKVSKIYPNPSKSYVSFDIELAGPENIIVTIYDLTGKAVLSHHAGKLPAGNHTLVMDLRGLQPGLYLYNMTTGTGVVSGKIILR